MDAFEKVVGYEQIKTELLQIADIIKNREKYEKLGARMPKGVLIFGEPGLGKTLLAEEFIRECGVYNRTVRRSSEDMDFISEMHKAFRDAKANVPSVILLDDMDKYANEDKDHADAKEYIAVQACIDNVKDEDVFIIATVNDIHKLPKSLRRAGRFDRKIRVEPSEGEDALKIIKHYLSAKAVDRDINVEDIVKMSSSSSCAELEMVLNEAAIFAAYEGCSSIGIEHITEAVLRMQYHTPKDANITSGDELEHAALHEAGHIVMAEAIREGSVGLASVRAVSKADAGGFVHMCEKVERRPHAILISLAGKAAVEMYHAGRCAGGCASDLEKASNLIRSGMTENATLGFAMLDKEHQYFSETHLARCDAAVTVELERYMRIARQNLLDNREFLEKVRDALMEKETLLHSDVKFIRKGCIVKNVVV